MGHDATGALEGGGTGGMSMVPASARSRKVTASGGGSLGHGQGRRVLVVEDEANISEAIRFILRRDGWEVEVEGTGDGALDRIRSLEPHVVILDVMLPGLSGFDILRALRGQPGTASLPVIVLTAKGSSATRDTARDAGASLFMAKPFANADLLAAVRQLVGV